MAIFWSVVGIVICGGVGGLSAWALVTTLGWDGAPGAIAAAVIGMVLSVALWTAITAILRTIGRIR